MVNDMYVCITYYREMILGNMATSSECYYISSVIIHSNIIHIYTQDYMRT